MKLIFSIAAACAGLIFCLGGPASMASEVRSISSVNGGVHAAPGESYDSLSTVNGDVHMGIGASAESAKTVNGEVRLDENARVGNASTVNGSLKVDEGGSVTHDASTVNGSVRLAKGVHVGGDVSTVSGNIELSGAEIGGQINTHDGDIDLTDGARVRGGIHVKKPNGSNWGWGKHDLIKVHVCSTCVVEGDLRFDRPVELRVDEGAKIGKVIGDSVTRR